MIVPQKKITGWTSGRWHAKYRANNGLEFAEVEKTGTTHSSLTEIDASQGSDHCRLLKAYCRNATNATSSIAKLIFSSISDKHKTHAADFYCRLECIFLKTTSPSSNLICAKFLLFQPTGSCGKDMLDVPGESDAKAGGIGWTGYHAVWFAEQVTKRHQMAHIPTQRIVGVDPSIRRLFLSFFSGFG